MKVIKNILFLIFLASCISSFAQQNVTKDKSQLPKKEINGQWFYLYQVQKENTLYSISKYFNVPIQVIISANPQIKQDGLSVNEIIDIPIKEKSETAISSNKNSSDIFGNDFIFHKVSQGETLYSISKTYNINVKDIVAINPGADTSISIGEVLRLPIAKIKKKDDDSLKPLYSKYKQITIKRHQTLYSISRKYKVNIDSIKKVNDGLKGGLKAGQTINLPILKKRLSTLKIAAKMAFNNDSTALDTIYNKKSSYNIDLFLPFFVQSNTQWQQQQLASSEKRVFPKSKVALDFYYGFKLGLDSFYAAAGDSVAHINLKVFDLAKDSIKTDSICNSPVFKNADLVVGPLYLSCLKVAKKYALEYKKPLVVPVHQNSKLVLNNPYLQLAITPVVAQMKNLAHYAVDSLLGSNFIVINHRGENDSLWATTFIKEFDDYASSKKDSSIFHKPKSMVITGNDFLDNLKAQLRSDTTNTIVLPTNDRIFVTMFFNRINALTENYKITVLGLENWLGYTNIDPSFLQNTNLTLTCSAYTLADDSLTNKIKYDYIRKYNTFPDYYSFVGWELADYYAGMLNKFGTGFLDFVPEEKRDLPFYRINYLKTGPISGLINTGSVVIKLEDYKFHVVY